MNSIEEIYNIASKDLDMGNYIDAKNGFYQCLNQKYKFSLVLTKLIFILSKLNDPDLKNICKKYSQYMNGFEFLN